MTKLLRLPDGAFPLLLVICGIFSLLPAQAQQNCPAAASACTPGAAPAANLRFGMGITQVQLESIQNTTAGAQDGYKDYSCTVGTTLVPGKDYPITITTNASVNENVRVWLDLNNDGTFNATQELLFSSKAQGVHKGSIRVPSTAVVGQRLRLRIAADYALSPVPTPCSTPEYSQTEDYSITLAANTSAPTADFTVDQPVSCTGCVQFTDLSQNLPATWQWSFGDGTSSTEQHPRHCYAAPGTYTVSLAVTNAAGTNTLTRAGYIFYDTAQPVAASCTPTTAEHGFGITRFTFGPFINNTPTGQAGYEDYTCNGKIRLTGGYQYPIAVATESGSPQDTRVWLDANNDGIFEPVKELVFEALSKANPSGTITLPYVTAASQPMRLRVISDFAGAAAGPCTNPRLGQVEDYTLVILPVTQLPVVQFASNHIQGTCIREIRFTDQTTNFPSSWRWDFGDGKTSTEKSPLHTYAAPGLYSVSLTATNNVGTVTLSQPDYVYITPECLQYCTSTGTSTFAWISKVSVNNSAGATVFTSASASEPTGYGNYLTRFIRVQPQETYAMSVAFGTTTAVTQHTTAVWLDGNRNGIFESTELLYTTYEAGLEHKLTFKIPTQLPAGAATRLRVQVNTSALPPNPCSISTSNLETEDYTLVVGQQALATAPAQALAALTVYPNPTSDGTLHLRLADGNRSGTYAATVENLLGKRLAASVVRLTPDAEATMQLPELPHGLYLLRLRDANGNTTVRRFARE
ncbi:GEVED domain-containing protein [Hymenobacter sp. BT491]|uniref:GEVED domain-containing protein n=1 Tax=Hymenobacter sp. BT491 TaxID=2766779 RepID=UPI0016539E1B|nr:GEVED domain-containing protein [Hymenobacter sp. BT491]MBC6989384.1 PKD domain-containing protein [Hymenobacter sp. BT491]